MTTTWVIRNSNSLMETKWTPMLVLSVLFHVAIFSVVLFIPESFPTRTIEGVIYEVNLVEMPAGRDLRLQGSSTAKGRKSETMVKRDTRARRIKSKKRKEKPLVIAKRTAEKKTAPIKKPKISASQMIDSAISRIEAKVKSEDKTDVDKAISKLESKIEGRYDSGPPGRLLRSGIPIRIYQMEVENRIKSNWSYPVALHSPRDRKRLEAIVLVKVKRDGTILKSWFKERSSSAMFNQSVMKAIERSNPLPPFPEGYRKTYDEIEINFNLKDLEGH